MCEPALFCMLYMASQIGMSLPELKTSFLLSESNETPECFKKLYFSNGKMHQTRKMSKTKLSAHRRDWMTNKYRNAKVREREERIKIQWIEYCVFVLYFTLPIDYIQTIKNLLITPLYSSFFIIQETKALQTLRSMPKFSYSFTFTVYRKL